MEKLSSGFFREMTEKTGKAFRMNKTAAARAAVLLRENVGQDQLGVRRRLISKPLARLPVILRRPFMKRRGTVVSPRIMRMRWR